MKKRIIVFLLTFLMMFTIYTISYAGDINPDDYKSIYSTAGVSD